MQDFYSGVRNPSIPSLDLTLAKKIPITESKELPFRWEAFNALNTHLYGAPDTNPGDLPSRSPTVTGAQECTGFGNIDTAQQLNFQRMQVAVKFIFTVRDASRQLLFHLYWAAWSFRAEKSQAEGAFSQANSYSQLLSLAA